MRRKFLLQNLCMILLPMMIPLLVLGIFATILVQKTVTEEVRKNNQMMLTQVKNSTQLVFNELDVLSINFSLNASFVSRLRTLLSADSVDYDNANIQRWFSDIINSTVNAKPYIHSVYVYYENPKDNMFVANYGITKIDNYPDKDWLSRYQAIETDIFFETRYLRLFNFETTGTPVVTIYQKLYSPGTSTSDGVIVMNIRQSYLEGLLSTPDTSYPQSIFLLDLHNQVLATGLTATIRKDQIDFSVLDKETITVTKPMQSKQSYVIMQIPSERYGLKYVSANSQDDIYRLPIALNRITLLLLYSSFLLALSLAWLFTKQNCRQLESIIDLFYRAEKGEDLPAPTHKNRNAYDYIQQKVIRTFVQSSYLKVQLDAKKYQTKVLEMTALQTQINPHFLFNTLKTIFWKTISLTESQNEASRMIEDLSEILQYSISPPSRLVSLAEEIRNTEHYINIQKVRYQNRFEIYWEYEIDVLEFQVFRLLFQPFIENSIYHGCRNDNTKCIIKIKLQRCGDRLHVSIIDNGQGIQKIELHNIRKKLSGKLTDDELSSHIGLFNTHKRLQLFYGESHGIRILSKEGVGTVVKFSLFQNSLPLCNMDSQL